MNPVFRRLAVTSTITLGLVASGLGATSANASSAEAGNGATRVAVAPRVAKIITNAGIAATPVGHAKAFGFEGTVALRFPITKVSADGNRISHSGGVKLASGHEQIVLQRFRVNLKRGYVSAIVNHGDRLAVFNLADSNRPRLGPVRLTFNKTSASAINGTFGVGVFKAGQNFGFAKVNPA